MTKHIIKSKTKDSNDNRKNNIRYGEHIYDAIVMFQNSVLALDSNWSNSSILMSILSLFHKVGAAYKNDRSKNLVAQLLLIESIATRIQR